MSGAQFYPIVSQPGIKRDGTAYAGNYYIDGQWVRFQRGLPRKIGGFIQMFTGLVNIVRDMFVAPASPNFNVYVADSDALQYFPVDQFGTLVGGPVNRTPVGFVANANNIWQFDTMFTVANASLGISAGVQLFAHAAPNLSFIDSEVNTPVYYGSLDGTTPLVNTGINVSGGILTLGPFLFSFGTDGIVNISNQNDPTTILASLNPTRLKIVAGAAVRGGNSSPAGLLWSLNSLLRVTYVGATAVGDPVPFRFDTVTDQSSILSSSSIIEYDSRYFWCGIDRFLVYNGIVQEVPNQLSLDFFFQNLNYSQRQKVWATKVPQYGEIWWHFPYGTATECNHAVIYNIRENTWYDTEIHRSAGYFEQVFADPIWANNVPNISNQYNVYRHETGNDQNDAGVITTIDSFIETGDISWCAVGPTGSWNGTNRWTDLYRIEPDFWQQAGDITVTINGREYAQSATVQTASYTLAPGQEKLDLREQRRFMTIRFDNNAVGGFWELGQLLLFLRIGDVRA